MNYISKLAGKSNKNTSKNKKTDTILSYQVFIKIVVPKVGIEPTRYRYRWILSPVRLPISPLGQRVNYILVKKTRKQKRYLNTRMLFVLLIIDVINRDYRRRRKGLMNLDQYVRQ